MKKSNLKTPRRKIIPHHYQKKSNTSLSQLLAAGSYKKRINDLVRNNRCLAQALQVSRSEAATQSNLLKDYSRDSNYIMFARLKLKDIVKSIAKVVTDLDEVMNYLDVNWASTNIQLTQRDRSPSETRLKIKVPSISDIAEVSTLSESNTPHSSSPKISSTSNEILPQESCDDNKQYDCSEIDLPAFDEDTVSDDRIPPVLFVDEPNGSNKRGKKSSEKQKSCRRKSSLFQRSLTPVLDIDFSYSDKRSSSLKPVQIDASGSRKTRSAGRKSESKAVISPPVASLDKSVIEACEGQESLKIRKQSRNKCKRSDFSQEEFSENLPSVTNPSTPILSPLCNSPLNIFSNIESGLITSHTALPISVLNKSPIEVSSEISTNCATASQTTHTIPSNRHVSAIKTISHITDNIEANSHCILNKTLFLNDDMELTDVVPVINSAVAGNDTVVPSIPDELKFNPYDCVKSEGSGIHEDVQHNVKLNESGRDNIYTELTEVYDVNSCTNNPVREDAADNIDKTLQPIEDGNVLSDNSVSPVLVHSVRKRKPINYQVYFSSDESDLGSPPSRPISNKKQCTRVTAIFNPKSSKKTSKTPGEHNNIQKNSWFLDTSLNDFTIFDFNSSNSEASENNKERKLHKKLTVLKKKKINSNELPSKPLSKKCNVTKLKGFNYKFSKETTVDNSNELNNIDKESVKSILGENTAVPVDISLGNEHLSDIKDKGISNKMTKSNSDSDTIMNSSELENLSSLTPNSEARRVSFAATDMICKFKKMSQTKTISANRKISQTSKCLFELEKEASFEELNNSLPRLAAESSKQKLPSTDDSNSLCDFSGVTELYTVKLPMSSFYPLPQPFDPHSKNASTKENNISNKNCVEVVDEILEEASNKNCVEIVDEILEEASNVGKKFSGSRKASVSKTSIKKHLDVEIDDLIKNTEPVSKNKSVPKKIRNSKKKLIENNSQAILNLDTENVKSKSIITPESYPSKQNCKNSNSKKKMVENNSQAIPNLDTENVKPKSIITPESYPSKQNCKNKRTSIYSHPSTVVLDGSEKKHLLGKSKATSKFSMKGKNRTSIANTKSADSSFVLKDIINLEYQKHSTDENDVSKADETVTTRRRSKQVSYKEPSLNKKLRRT